MSKSPVFRTTDKTVTYADRFGERLIADGQLYRPDEEIHLMDCDFTLNGFGIFRCVTNSNLAWVHRDTIEYVSGNLGLRADGEEK